MEPEIAQAERIVSKMKGMGYQTLFVRFFLRQWIPLRLKLVLQGTRTAYRHPADPGTPIQETAGSAP